MKKYLLAISLLSFLQAGRINCFAQNPKAQEQQIKQELKEFGNNVFNTPQGKAIRKNNNDFIAGKKSSRAHIFDAIDIMLDFDYEDLMVADILQLKEYIKELRKQKSQNYPNFKKIGTKCIMPFTKGETKMPKRVCRFTS